MVSIEIKGLPFCPRNRSHASIYNAKAKRSMVVKTEAGRLYEKALKKQLDSYKEDLAAIKEEFNPYKHGLMVNFYLGTPDYYTKDGKLSQTSTDLDAHKILQDVVMEAVGIDDGYIIRSLKEKFPSCQFYYLITIDLVWLENGGDTLG